MRHTVRLIHENPKINKNWIGDDIKAIVKSVAIKLVGLDMKDIELYIDEERYRFHSGDIAVIKLDITAILEKHEKEQIVDFGIDGLFEI